MTKLIAEVGINHNGSIPIAKQLIDVAVDAGIDYVKFQKRTLDLVYSKAELDAPRESPWGKTNRDQKQGLEFSIDQYREIDEYCKFRGIEWFVSCWDIESLAEMERAFPSMPYHKVASAMATDSQFLKAVRATGRSSILSTGMLNEEQVHEACRLLGPDLRVVMQCTSTYPTKPDEMNISAIKQIAKWVGSFTYFQEISGGKGKPDIGFSNHYSGLLWVPLSIAYGAKFLEFHVTLDRTMYGSDQAASLEPDGVKKLVEHVRLAEQMIGDGKKRVYDSELPIIKKLRKVTNF